MRGRGSLHRSGLLPSVLKKTSIFGVPGLMLAFISTDVVRTGPLNLRPPLPPPPPCAHGSTTIPRPCYPRLQQAISPRDAPLAAFMSSMVRALGVSGIFCMRDDPVPSGHEGSDNGAGPDVKGVLSRDAAAEFFENFLVPRFVASASCRGAKPGGVVALETIVGGFFQAEAGEASPTRDLCTTAMGHFAILARAARAFVVCCSIILSVELDAWKQPLPCLLITGSLSISVPESSCMFESVLIATTLSR